MGAVLLPWNPILRIRREREQRMRSLEARIAHLELCHSVYAPKAMFAAEEVMRMKRRAPGDDE